MTINYTTLLGLAQPVTGTEQGTWGDTVNTEITALLEDAIADAATFSVTSGDVTLTSTAGQANQARMAILLVTGTPGVSRNIIAPSQSKWYIVKNSSDASVVLKGSATTGVTILAGTEALCFWNGSDFEIVGVNGPSSSTDNAVVRFDGTTGKVIQNSGVTIDDSNNVSGVAQLNATTADLTNIEVTNIKAKDGTASASIADSTGVITIVKDAIVNGVTVGEGAGSVATNTALGASALAANTTGANNTAVGYQALDANTTGQFNTAIGSGAVGANTTASFNTAVGYNAALKSTIGRAHAFGYLAASENTGEYISAFGYLALQNSTGGANTAFGHQAGKSTTTGASNTFVGHDAGQSNTTASNNSAFGWNALGANTTGANNTAVGYGALDANTTGGNNVAVGVDALGSVTTGGAHVAIGSGAGASTTTTSASTYVGFRAGFKTTGAKNAFVGSYVGYENTSGAYNAVLGGDLDGGSDPTFYNNTTGSYNAVLGGGALAKNTTGSNNTAMGYQALYANTTGANNTAVGYQALDANTTGVGNVAMGFGAGTAVTTGLGNTIVGREAGEALTTGNNCTFVGEYSGEQTTGGQNTFIGGDSGYLVTTGAKNTIIGRYNGNQDGLDIRTASNYAVISDGDGNRLLSTYNGGTLALDGGAVPQAGTGITFPATQSASSNANTLDDYEEGDFTPTVGGTWTSNPTNLAGRYTKIGDLVCIWVTWTGGTKASAISGHIAGMPFTVSSAATGTVSDVDVIDRGIGLLDTGSRIFLTNTSFSASTNYTSYVYRT